MDGYSPGRILRISSIGVLEVLAALQFSRSISTALVDGPLSSATAYTLSCLTFIDGGRSLLFADTPKYSFVRRLDLDTGTVTRLFGAVTGSARDGLPFLETVFAAITHIETMPDGSVLIVDGGANVIRVGISDNSTFVSVAHDAANVHVFCCAIVVLLCKRSCAGSLSIRLHVQVCHPGAMS